jgi:hypothetical protein
MHRQISYALGLLLATAGPLYAVDLTGSWFVCNDCSGGGACSTQSQEWAITQTGTSLSIDTNALDFTGTIDPGTGVFDIPNPPNFVEFHGTGTFSTIDGTYDSGLQSGNIFGGRLCDPMSPACDDGDSCTDDACVNTTVGPCPDLVDVCINTQNGSCTTTTSSSTSTTTTTTLLPATHHPVAGTKLVIKKAASGKETLIFVTKDPTVYVPPFGGPDDPTTIQTQITARADELLRHHGAGGRGEARVADLADADPDVPVQEPVCAGGYLEGEIHQAQGRQGPEDRRARHGAVHDHATRRGRYRLPTLALRRRYSGHLRALRGRDGQEGRPARVQRQQIAGAGQLSSCDAAATIGRSVHGRDRHGSPRHATCDKRTMDVGSRRGASPRLLARAGGHPRIPA